MILVPTRAVWVVKRIFDPEGGNVGGGHVAFLLEPGRELAQRIWDDGAREEGGRGVFLGATGAVVVVVRIHGGERVRACRGGEVLYLSGSGSGRLSWLLCGFPTP